MNVEKTDAEGKNDAQVVLKEKAPNDTPKQPDEIGKLTRHAAKCRHDPICRRATCTRRTCVLDLGWTGACAHLR